jgi:hypothetical protein
VPCVVAFERAGVEAAASMCACDGVGRRRHVPDIGAHGHIHTYMSGPTVN